MPNAQLFLALLTAHTLGDFYFQTDKMSKEKEKNFEALIFHSFLYGLPFIFLFLIIDFSTRNLYLIALCGFIHFLIDAIKFLLRGIKLDRKKIFIIDQAAHLISLVVLTNLFSSVSTHDWTSHIPTDFFRWLTIGLLILRPANLTTKIFFKKYADAAKKGSKNTTDTDNTKDSNLIQTQCENNLSDKSNNLTSNPQVDGAGALVGSFERILTVILLNIGGVAGLGLLIAAKSVARYDKISKESAFAEYYLIGTLYSILFAVLSYWLVFKVILPVEIIPDPTPIILMTPTAIP